MLLYPFQPISPKIPSYSIDHKPKLGQPPPVTLACVLCAEHSILYKVLGNRLMVLLRLEAADQPAHATVPRSMDIPKTVPLRCACSAASMASAPTKSDSFIIDIDIIRLHDASVMYDRHHGFPSPGPSTFHRPSRKAGPHPLPAPGADLPRVFSRNLVWRRGIIGLRLYPIGPLPPLLTTNVCKFS